MGRVEALKEDPVTHAAVSHPGRSSLFARLFPVLLVLALAGAAVWMALGDSLPSPAPVRLRPHLPDPAVLRETPLAVQIHLAAALGAFMLGLAQFALPKGTGLHRTLGWTWVLLIGAAAVSSLFIRYLNHGAFSLIHILSAWTLVVLPMAVYAVRRGDIRTHRNRMTGLFIGGLLIAGVLAFAPGRLMWRLFLGD